jgi:hypothetical protein
MTNPYETSEARLQANTTNAQKSTGPRTEAGKNVARFNARRHGLTGQFYVISEGDEKAYGIFEASLLEKLAPVGPCETQIAISIIQDEWRLNRSRSTEHNIYGRGHLHHAEQIGTDSPNIQVAAAGAETWKEDVRAFSNIALYETRIHRMMARNEKRLHDLQQERRAAEALAREEAELLLRLAHFKGEKVDLETPLQVNGFVFSPAAIVARLKRDALLKEARFYQKGNWNRVDRYRYAPEDLPIAA